ncbi:hypothetical protein DEU56DRAFT_474686 [Suillus clintonianus]|uniref:uncharacterized protein n=1 Tax=Suillus clintonianus TaxID=1904413 RepID=UPI001B867503|nr:uncharacterized protein DEU56DRAFT_474686 [Suillus clintonianus]KAG2153250.1 hypothetical protein DEU56DRAFT_474686 [Suillus clintonianus]
MVVSTRCKCRQLLVSFLAFAVLASSLLQGAMAQTTYSTATQQLQRLQDPNVIITDTNGTVVVYSPLTGNEIPQGLATDGSGSGFSLPAVLWIAFSFTVGVPFMLAGFRGWRLTTATAIGLSVVVTSWSVFVNTLDNVGISDITLTVLVLVLFCLGFLFGLLEVGRMAGVLQLGIQGGLAIGIRIVLLRKLLLIPDPAAFFVNWLLIAFCALASAILVIWKQRAGLLLGSASVGTFFCALGTDLAVNQQSGMSRGLRYLIDRNRYHIVDTTNNGYFPPTSTLVMIALSIALTPAFAYAQHKLFKGPFCIVHDDDLESLHAPNEFPADEEPKISGEETPRTSPPNTPLPTTPVLALSHLTPLLKDDGRPAPIATEKVRPNEGNTLADDS